MVGDKVTVKYDIKPMGVVKGDIGVVKMESGYDSLVHFDKGPILKLYNGILQKVEEEK